MPGNYDPAAWFYDSLASIIFGNSLKQAQVSLLPFIPPKASILIAGGGTGWILDEISVLHPQGLNITYVEISGKMIDRAKRRKAAQNRITFIKGPIQEVMLNESYDIILTPFLLDNFAEPTLIKIFEKVEQHLKLDGRWLFTDFNPNNSTLAARGLLKSMYLFFYFLCGLETTTLHDPAGLFRQFGYSPNYRKSFYGNFIHSIAYQKTTPAFC